MKKAIFAGFFILVLYCLYPFYCMHRLSTGLKENNAEQIASYVDFDSLRASLKEEAGAALASTQNQDSRKDKLAAGLAAALGSTLINNMIDSFATPSGLVVILQKIQASREPSGAEQPKPSLSEALAKISLIGPTEFKYDDPQKGVATFDLTGGRWKLTRYKPAPEIFKKILAK